MVEAAPVTLCGSLSRHPVSLGAAMHRAGYAALGLPFTYVPFATEDLEGALRGMRALGIRGFGVSMPFKLDIIPLVDRLDPLAERIGAVNTVVNDAGVLTGFNTDAWGAARALEEVTALTGKRALVLGAGGAARAVAYSLASEGMRVRLANRTRAGAEALAAALRAAFPEADPSACGLDDLRALDDLDVLVNGSSAGMAEYGAASPLPPGLLHPALVVMDIVYKPLDTELVRAARRAGCPTVNGGRMLLHQAARQFELYTGHPAPLAAMDEALRAAIGA
ncbi:MAG: shikimate dehydrogenase [Sorangiineae bacterium]|nr:shikimate dehydrogenase [Polyangiaceae bacterium]MEB2323198.1 shikimate dehydrogenase [Sorangiineae bacterium]